MTHPGDDLELASKELSDDRVLVYDPEAAEMGRWLYGNVVPNEP